MALTKMREAARFWPLNSRRTSIIVEEALLSCSGEALSAAFHGLRWSANAGGGVRKLLAPALSTDPHHSLISLSSSPQ